MKDLITDYPVDYTFSFGKTCIKIQRQEYNKYRLYVGRLLILDGCLEDVLNEFCNVFKEVLSLYKKIKVISVSEYFGLDKGKKRKHKGK